MTSHRGDVDDGRPLFCWRMIGINKLGRAKDAALEVDRDNSGSSASSVNVEQLGVRPPRDAGRPHYYAGWSICCPSGLCGIGGTMALSFGPAW